MAHLKMPYDNESAMEVMRKFTGMAYSLVNKNVFSEAVKILYGPEFLITVDLSKRMQFACQICNREMNSEKAMKEHGNSGGHQKNLDKKNRATGVSSFSARACNYATDSIQFRLLNSSVPPLGLQMVEEYINRRGNQYYKCMLCAAHGKLDMMYQHLIGKKHTEKYIKNCCVLENSILNPNEREALRKKLVQDEGVNVDAIKTIKGDQFYPFKWEREGVTSRLFNHKFKRGMYGSENFNIKMEEGIRDSDKIKREQRSSSGSPAPGPSRGRSRSISPRRGYFGKSPSHSGDHSRSPFCRRQSASPSPVQERRRNWSSSSSASESRFPSPKRGINENSIFSIKREPSLPDPPRGIDSEDLSSYRNRSPPPVQIKAEPVSPPPVQIKAEPVSPPVRIKSEPLSPPTSPGYMHSVQLPVAVEKQKSDAAVQTSLNLELEMGHLNDYIMNCSGEPLRTPLEAKAAIDLMNTYAIAIRGVILKLMEDGAFRNPEKMRMLEKQKVNIDTMILRSTGRFLR
ncbi:uncharacterized protein LOC135205737 isoform X2 [Macrobrachium nipponense]|uniref:uncharacterized protein LOC135205737 isoform X2 n=1 Tax=Macrobrachium nipponense TaxID=159736 RepID=UPI0030C85725